MIIKKLEIQGFKRVFLSEINKLLYTPKEKIQMILGTNGSGKSQLLTQLTPLPANINKDYKENGYKIIEIEYNNKTYILHSGVNGKNKHSFLVEDIELNPSGTGKVQQQLVKEHFNITPHIHQILLGNTKFTSMSAIERKKWITEISTIDYTYPIAVFNRLKQRHRDVVGGLKILQENIVKLENGLLSNEELKRLSLDRDKLNEFIEHLISLLSHDVQENQLSTTIKELHKYNEQLRYSLVNDTGLGNTKDIIVLIEQKNQLITRNNKITHEMDQLAKIVESNTDKNTVLKTIEDLSLKLKVLTESVYVETTDLKTMISSFKGSYSDIVGILSELLEYDQWNATKDNYTTLDNILTEKLTLKETMVNRLKLIETEILGLEKLNTEENQVECPKCSNIWRLNYDVNKHEVLKNDREQYLLKITTLTKDIVARTKDLDHIKAKRDIIKNIGNMVTTQLSLKPIFIYLLKGFSIYTESINIPLSKLEYLSQDINKWDEINQIELTLKEQEIALKEIELSEKLKKEFNNISGDKLKIELDSNTKQLNVIKNDIIVVENILRREQMLKELVTKTTNQLAVVYSDKKKYLNLVRNNHLKELIGLLKEEYLEITNRITDATSYLDKIKEDRKRLDEYNKKEKVLKVLLKELSPNEGLIAKSINSFLNVFINDINKLINTVWSYDMYLLPCEVGEGNDLDYKFRVRVNGAETIEDISKTSSSMQEMIDLAFKIVFMKYAGLQEAPLILDEFGRTFDAEHRVSAYATIDKIIANKFSQLFIVSHYESLYGRFNNVDINILNSDGVDTDTINEYNTVFKIG
jgi:hypothetical protein